jgi:hypothetical protein
MALNDRASNEAAVCETALVPGLALLTSVRTSDLAFLGTAHFVVRHMALDGGKADASR